MGQKFCHEKFLLEIENSKIEDSIVIGITNKFVPYIAFRPVLLAIITGTNVNKAIARRLYLGK